MTQEKPNIVIRPATAADRAFILNLVPRFVEFGPPAWRDSEQMTVKNQQVVTTALDAPASDAQILVATAANGEPLGFIHLQTNIDYFSGEPYGYISDIAVAIEGEGRGVGRALMAAGEAWAQQQGYSVLSLNVFTANQGTCRFYETLGYREEIRQYVKVLTDI